MKTVASILNILIFAGMIINLFLWKSLWILVLLFVLILISGEVFYRSKTRDKRILRMMSGVTFLGVSFAIILVGMVLGILALFDPFVTWGSINWWPVAAGGLAAALFLIAGYFLVLFNSKHLRVVWRVLLLITWWIPLWNIVLFIKVFSITNGEYKHSLRHEDLMKVHVENLDCETKYPIIMVHGIFFRDWQLLNYWGRIPRELTRCGARIFYGSQQSAASVAESAGELAETIRKVIESTGSEKVNIIAHSKGGLDSRYAISKLGMADFVASLTTVNTPHSGCVWVRELLDKTPKPVIGGIAKRYNRIFFKLGDKAPDFISGLNDLTDTAAKKFNEEAPDHPGVYYQSVMSLMSGAASAGFPLNLGHHFVMKYDREINDGLVARSSALWGNPLGEIRTGKKRGVSHGDMVDLFREDIPGFDVTAYYADIVRSLRQMGF